MPVRRQPVARREQRVELQLGVGDRLAHGETDVAQSRSRDRDEQGFDRHPPRCEIGEAHFNQFCSRKMGDDHGRTVRRIPPNDQQNAVDRVQRKKHAATLAENVEVGITALEIPMLCRAVKDIAIEP